MTLKHSMRFVLVWALVFFSFVNLRAEEVWSGMVIVDKKSALHGEGAKDRPALSSPIVLHVAEDSNAYVAGLRSGDYIIGTAENITLSVAKLEEFLKKPVPLKVQNSLGLRVVPYKPTPVDARAIAYLRIKELLRQKKVVEFKDEVKRLSEEQFDSPIVNFMAGFAFGAIKDKELAFKCLEQTIKYSPESLLANICRKRLPADKVARIELEIADNPPKRRVTTVPEEKPPGKEVVAQLESEEPQKQVIEGVDTDEPGQTKGKMPAGIDPDVFFKAGLDEKVEILRKALAKSPGDSELRLGLSGCILKTVLRDKATKPFEDLVNLLQESADITPKPFDTRYIWGNILLEKKSYDNAIEQYRMAVEAKPEHVDSNTKLGMCLINVMKYEESIQFLEKALQGAPTDFPLHYYLAVANFETKDFDDALDYIEKAMPLAKNQNQETAATQLMQKIKEQSSSGEGSTVEENQRFIVQFAGDSQQDIGDQVMEMLESSYDQVTDDLMYKPDIKINVLFFRTEEFYQMNKTPKWAGAMAKGAEILVPLKQGYRMDRIKGILAHEFTHVIINLRTNNRCPTWIHEGLAVFEENKSAYGDPFTLRPDYERVFRDNVQTEGQMLPLKSISLDYRTQGVAVSLGYVVSYLAIRFFIDKWDWAGIDELMTEINKGSHWTEALQAATNRDIGEFQTEFESWVGGVQ